MLLFQILLRAHAQEKKTQNGIPFWVAALLLSHRGQGQPDTLSGLDLDPVIMFFRDTSITGEIALQNLLKKSNHSFD